MGELTPGTQLSMGSAKRLYVLMAGFYMNWAFKTSAVKSRHRIFTFTSSVFVPPHLPPYLKFYLSIPKQCVRQSNISSEVPMARHTTSQIILYMFRAEWLSSDCHWKFVFEVQLQIPVTVTEPLGFKLFLVHVKLCEIVLESKGTQTWTEQQKHAADVRRTGSSSTL